MKIYNRFPYLAPTTPAGGNRAGDATPDAFQSLLKGKCQETGAPASPRLGTSCLDLAGSVLDALDRIASQMAAGADPRDLATAHTQLANQAEHLRQAAESVAPGKLRDLMGETASLAYVQLWRFEQGEL